MNFTQVVNALTGHFINFWSSNASTATIPYYFDNQKHEEKNIYARFSIFHLSSEPSTYNNVRQKKDGLATIGIFVPAGDGVRQATNIAQIVVDNMEAKSIQQLETIGSTIIEADDGSESGKYQLNIVNDFTWYSRVR